VMPCAVKVKGPCEILHLHLSLRRSFTHLSCMCSQWSFPALASGIFLVSSTLEEVPCTQDGCCDQQGPCTAEMDSQ